MDSAHYVHWHGRAGVGCGGGGGGVGREPLTGYCAAGDRGHKGDGGVRLQNLGHDVAWGARHGVELAPRAQVKVVSHGAPAAQRGDIGTKTMTTQCGANAK